MIVEKLAKLLGLEYQSGGSIAQKFQKALNKGSNKYQAGAYKDSEQYVNPYNDGTMTSVNGEYEHSPLQPFTKVGDAPDWLKYKKEYYKNNPKEEVVKRYLNKFARNLGNDENNYPKWIDENYEKDAEKYAAKQLHRNKSIDQRGLNRVEYLNSLPEREQLILQENLNRYQPSLWHDAKRGLQSMFSESIPGQREKHIINDKSLTRLEKLELLRQAPTTASLTEPLGILSPLSVPAKAVQSLYKSDYNFSDALSGTKNEAGIVEDIMTDPLTYTGLGLLGKASKIKKAVNISKLEKSLLGNIDNSLTKIETSPILENKAISNINNETSNSWSLQELPGLHLKSTMEGQAISKIIEPKTGLINVEQALAIIGKESGGAEKVDLVRKGLGETIPKKMDYNEFRKITQDQLIPLEKSFMDKKSHFGIGNLGYPSPKKASFETAIGHSEAELENLTKKLEDMSKIGLNWTSGEKLYTVRNRAGGLELYRTEAEALENQKSFIDNIQEEIKTATYNRDNNLLRMKELPIENQTIILGNKSKFGLGAKQHDNPEETLGHIHFLRDAETPNILTVTQIQSDAFQGTHRIMPKNNFDINRELQFLKDDAEEMRSIFKGNSKKDKERIDAVEKKLNLYNAHVENFSQKQLLDKSHQERYIQEFVDYAGKRGDVDKIRVPTSETAAKVQGYAPIVEKAPGAETKKLLDSVNNYEEFKELVLKRLDLDDTPSPEEMDLLKKSYDKYKRGESTLAYSPEHQTILKKYSEQPKTIKKLFGEEPKIVTDSKGNTWYEFDIPDKFKKGKGEIKALGLLPLSTGLQNNNQQNQTGGGLLNNVSNIFKQKGLI